VVVEQLWLHHALAGAADAPTRAATVLDAHNVETEVYASIAASTRSAPAATTRERRLAATMAERTRALEQAVIGAVDQVWACSELDAGAFRRMGADARVVPNAVDTNDLRLRPAAARAPNLVFPASFAYPPNVLAARLLVEEILPRLADRVGPATVTLVGRDPPRWLRRRAEHDPTVEVTGAVTSTRPWLERATAMVVPLHEGSGTRFKVLEAMALGLPVVSTPKGVEGLDVVAGRHVLVGRDSDELAELAADVHRSEPADLVRAARVLVEADYSWTSVARSVRAATVTGNAWA
jgi:glycosyltransferase involved in cell wall biosynthesis